MRKMLGFIVALVAIWAPLVPGFADGIIIPIPGPDIPGPPALAPDRLPPRDGDN
jgi:hypothetical protein